MGLYLAGPGSFSFGYTDDDGVSQWQRVNPRQDVMQMGLPKGVIGQLKQYKSGRNLVFFETPEAPAKEAGYSSGPISMDRFKDAPKAAEAAPVEEVPEAEPVAAPHVVVTAVDEKGDEKPKAKAKGKQSPKS